jgi:hypothetical protein
MTKRFFVKAKDQSCRWKTDPKVRKLCKEVLARSDVNAFISGGSQEIFANSLTFFDLSASEVAVYQ